MLRHEHRMFISLLSFPFFVSQDKWIGSLNLHSTPFKQIWRPHALPRAHAHLVCPTEPSPNAFCSKASEFFLNLHKSQVSSLAPIHVLHSSQNNRLITNTYLFNSTTFHFPYAPNVLNVFLPQPLNRNSHIVQNLHILFNNGSLHSIHPHF